MMRMRGQGGIPQSDVNLANMSQAHLIALGQQGNASHEQLLEMQAAQQGMQDMAGKQNIEVPKVNFYPRTDDIVYHKKHTDLPFEHTGALFYLNTNDGLTVLEDGTKIESIENRILLFDASRPHHSTTTSDQTRRMNINFNYL